MPEYTMHNYGEYPFNLDQCYVYYFDQNNNSANYTPPETTATPGSTSTISHQTEEFWSKNLVPIIAGSIGIVVLVFCTIVCCLCTARRERRKRKEIEGEYRIVASTLTNITDSEDGCTYETLSMRDPTYNGGVKLPTRKQKGGLKGVSNPFSAMKRLLSEDGESTGSTDTTITFSDYKRSQPLPAIPEAFHNKDTVKAIDDYTEIGSGSSKVHNVYHHLDSSGKAKDVCLDGNPYDTLRQSQIILAMEQEKRKTDDYFVLEKAKSDGKDEGIPQNRQSGGYFCLEKLDRVNSQSGLYKSSSQGVIIPSESVRALESSLAAKHSDENIESVSKTESEGLKVGNSDVTGSNTPTTDQNRLSNAYFTLAKENDSNSTQTPPAQNEYLDLEKPVTDSNRASYIEPSELQRHNYVDLVADFSKGKENRGGSIPAYAKVNKQK
ncbi:uncharacterized protein LOC125653790 isoform X2 [Ostrea edulis]|uniref:uncharacterized protein LOC125653790 isoform X2 n=1 Tax=Ostrea edulis TaxID=37623 RepID=UPI002095AB6E|nr:uncharacterized protein LOC125653790 isoform X2 [Ostrea edulis]